jgi:hypothetical protein
MRAVTKTHVRSDRPSKQLIIVTLIVAIIFAENNCYNFRNTDLAIQIEVLSWVTFIWQKPVDAAFYVSVWLFPEAT